MLFLVSTTELISYLFIVHQLGDNYLYIIFVISSVHEVQDEILWGG